MGATPLISVIVPVYNVEDYLEQCLDSILSQTYKNIEILVIDDGSTDRSGEICDTYAQKDTRIKVIHQENGGLSHARNVGIDLAKGAYLTFVDSDDGIHEPFLEELYNAIERYQVQIAVGDYYRYSESNQLFYYHAERSDGEQELFSQEQYWQHFNARDYIGLALWTAWGKLYGKELFEYVRFPEGRLIEDQAVVHRLFQQIDYFVMVHSNTYLHRERDNSIMRDANLRIRRVQDTLLAYERKVSDLLIAGDDPSTLLYNFVDLLYYHKHELDQACLQDTTVYKDILYRLNLWEKKKE